MVNLQRLKTMRREKGISQEEMASLLHISASTYQKYEQGARNITDDVLASVANILNVQMGIFTSPQIDENSDDYEMAKRISCLGEKQKSFMISLLSYFEEENDGKNYKGPKKP